MSVIRPTFLVVGAPKCGTTSLHHYLNQHPDIFLPFIKETRFFSSDKLFDRGLNFYSSAFFSSYSGQTAIGEICPEYIINPNAHRRIFEVLGKIKIIIIVRDPVERAYSHYCMQKVRGKEKRSFKDAINDELNELYVTKAFASNRWINDWHNHYISSGLYARQIQPYIDCFGLESVLCISFKDFKEMPDTVLGCICKFISVNNNYCFDISKSYNVAYRPRSKILENFLRKRSSLKELLKKSLPSYLLVKVKERLIEANSIPDKDRQIPLEIRNKLVDLFSVENEKLRTFFPYLKEF
jgi:hypothetical protein